MGIDKGHHLFKHGVYGLVGQGTDADAKGFSGPMGLKDQGNQNPAQQMGFTRSGGPLDHAGGVGKGQCQCPLLGRV